MYKINFIPNFLYRKLKVLLGHKKLEFKLKVIKAFIRILTAI